MVTLYLGGIRPLPPDNRPTGIFKQECVRPVWVGREGLVGDAQADRRVHGGPEKALHQYPVGHYAKLAAAFPAAADLLIPGSIGENISDGEWDEANVAIGDVFRLGDALVQVSQPRSPCWKIDARYGVDGMTKFIDDSGLVGWYFRVLEEGEAGPGCGFERIERPTPEATLRRLWDLRQAQRPDPTDLETFAAAPGLAPNWQDKLRQRAQWLRSL